MNFKDIVENLAKQREAGTVEMDDEMSEGLIGFMGEVFETGEKVLSKLSKDELAAMVSLVQTMVLTAAMEEGNFKIAILSNTEEFSDALIWAFQAAAGILTMEEVR